MKLIDLKLTNFKKLSNLPQPTITFNNDITILVGANNAGKTSILKAIQKLFRIETVEGINDLNYLVEDGSLIFEGRVTLTKEQWNSYLQLTKVVIPQPTDLEINELAEKLCLYPITLQNTFTFIKRKRSTRGSIAGIHNDVFNSIPTNSMQEAMVTGAINQIGNSDIFNVYNTPLYLDSKGEILEVEKFIPLIEIKNVRADRNNVNIRGLLYALKKEQPQQFEDFKKRLLEIFTELQDIDVRNNEELGQFELVLYEKLKKNGDSQLVTYDIKSVGQGMQTLVLMLSNILLLKPSIVLMDEPEVHMHPALIKEFIKYIKLLSVNTQFIITTHSITLMNEVGLDKLISLKYEPEQKGVIATRVDDHNKFLEAVNSMGYPVDSLTYTLKPKVFVFTEGTTDKDLILEFASKKGLSHTLNAFIVGFISMGGKGNRYKLAELIDKMNKEFIDSPILMILDRDETEPEQVEAIKNQFFSSNAKRLHYLSKRQIENYLLDEVAIKSCVAKRIKEEELKQKWETLNLRSLFLEFAESQKEDLLNNYLSEIFIGDSLIDTKSIREIIKLLSGKPLNESVREFKGEMAKLITLKTDDLGQKTSTAIALFEEKWQDPNIKLEMINGKKLLTALNYRTQQDFKVSFSYSDIINEMESIPSEIDSLLEQLLKPEELKINISSN